MIFHQLKCPNYGAILNVEDGLDTFYCKYCGMKLIATDQSDVDIRAKADIKLAEKEIERQRQEQEFKECEIQLQIENNKTTNKEENKALLLEVYAVIAIFFLFSFISCNADLSVIKNSNFHFVLDEHIGLPPAGSSFGRSVQHVF